MFLAPPNRKDFLSFYSDILRRSLLISRYWNTKKKKEENTVTHLFRITVYIDCVLVSKLLFHCSLRKLWVCTFMELAFYWIIFVWLLSVIFGNLWISFIIALLKTFLSITRWILWTNSLLYIFCYFLLKTVVNGNWISYKCYNIYNIYIYYVHIYTII